jgi:hypothetical protein
MYRCCLWLFVVLSLVALRDLVAARQAPFIHRAPSADVPSQVIPDSYSQQIANCLWQSTAVSAVTLNKTLKEQQND